MDNKDIALTIYNYGKNVFFGQAPKDVCYRLNQGYKGAAQMFLDWIWDNFIEGVIPERTVEDIENDIRCLTDELIFEKYTQQHCAQNPEDSYRESF